MTTRGSTASQQGGSGDEFSRGETVLTIAKGDDSRLVEPRRFVIRDAQAFAAVWTAHAGTDTGMPRVDFDAQMVVAVFAGERPTPGFGIAVTGTEREADALVVLVEATGPETSGVAAQVLTSPYHIAAIPRDDGEIRFNTPDPTGSGTIVFKPPKRQAPAPSAVSSADETTRLTRVPEVRFDRAERSATGLTPHVAATVAYLAGPFSGALLLATEPANRFVRFHAWQAVLALGALGVAAVSFLALAFAFLIVSPTAFWAMLWLSATTAVTWVIVWTLCVVQAYKGRVWKLPFVGAYAERRAA
jgi:uncharacterized membrane protein